MGAYVQGQENGVNIAENCIRVSPLQEWKVQDECHGKEKLKR